MTREQRVVRVPVYWLAVGLCCMVGSPLMAMLASVQIADRNAARIVHQQEAAKEQSREESRQAVCSFLGASLDVYIEAAPSTPAGKAQRERYLGLYKLYRCQPPRTQ